MIRTNRWIACLCTFLFLLCFFFSGITAATTAKQVTVQTSMTLPAVLYSVSSGATILSILAVILALIALISFGARQNSVGFLFLSGAVLLYIVFLVSFCLEKQNYDLYNKLSVLLKEQGAKGVKKRDVVIQVRPDTMSMITGILGIIALIVTCPSLKSKKLRSDLKKEIEPYLYIAPHLLLFIVFFLVPVIYGIYAAFTKWDIFGTPEFVGLSNFRTLLLDSANTYSRQMRNGLWNTIKFVFYSVPGCILLPLILALCLQVRRNKFFQGLFYLPALMSASSVMLAWEYFFKKTYGMVNNLFGSQANWFAPPYSWAMVVIITVWWCTGGNMVIYQSALAGIPTEHYEAASIDGANAWQRFWYITLPGMKYPLSYTLTTTLIAQFNVYAQVDILLGYNNSEANAVLMMYIKDTAFSQQVAGIASAMALILGLCIALFTLLQVRVMRQNV